MEESKYLKLHPKPKDCNIALVLSYNDLQIVYNGFGQRIGVKTFPEIIHQMVFYSDNQIVVADNESWITKYKSDFTEITSIIPEKIDRYFIDPIYKRAFTIFGNTFFKRNEEAIYSFFEMLIRHWGQLEKESLTQKYHKDNILDMIAICEILNFEIMTIDIIKRFTQRIETEIIKELSNDTQLIFMDVSDILYDEVHSWPIIKQVKSIVISNSFET